MAKCWSISNGFPHRHGQRVGLRSARRTSTGIDGGNIFVRANSPPVTNMASNVTNQRTALPNGPVSDLPGRGRVVASILGPVAWLSFTLVYVGFWAQGFSLFQSIIVILVSILVLGGLMGALWSSYGMRRARGAWNC
jgi:hypothetical protein